MIAARLPASAQAEHYTGVAEPAAPALAYALTAQLPTPLVILLARNAPALENLAGAYRFFAGAKGPSLPVRFLPDVRELDADDPRHFERQCDLLAAVTALNELNGQSSAGPRLILAALPETLLQPAPKPEALKQARLVLQRGEAIDFAAFTERLGAELGYENAIVCESPGQFAIRGGLIDVYPLNSTAPVRIDFFGDEVESLREFDPTTQRTEGDIEQLTLVAATPLTEVEATPWGGDRRPTVLDYLPETVTWVLLEPARLERQYPEVFAYPEKIAAPSGSFKHVLDARLPRSDRWIGLTAFENEGAGLFEGTRSHEVLSEALDAYRPFADADKLGLARTESEQQARAQFLAQLAQWHQAGYALHWVSPSSGENERLREILHASTPGGELLQARFHEGTIPEGFRLELGSGEDDRPSLRELWVTSAEVFGRKKVHLTVRRRRQAERRAVDDALDFTDLADGDYLVHLTHGICRYRGMQRLELSTGQFEEVISLEFADHVTLHLKLHDSHLLSRYVGLTKTSPKLGRLGGNGFRKTRAAAEKATLDFAAQLLRVQAERDAQPGHPFAPDSDFQRQFEGAFPFRETRDQLQAILETKADMERERPMDRLLCGDVGFGKTEVALRAALKCALDGKQCAVLVPTTVLCQQHFNTFRERFADTPVVVEMLSRFRSGKQKTEILRQLKAGSIDVLVGTHSLLGKGVAFKDLGLLVIDEEHRFGVKQKEKIKELRAHVDVLAMSATPIPRTLYGALVGVRDLSVIETPPRDRLPIQTFVKGYDPQLVQRAITAELDRGGQVFYLHNRVQTIASVAHRLQEMLPRARIGLGHGQMNEHELEQVMTDFVAGVYDVLVCTTIIETGLDIPNCNTLIIESADKYGLGQLYQLRGRVGRFNRQAYAYLLLPRGAQMLDSARQRLGAIRHYNQLGAGFRVAMRDLELRGAGNLLGPQQSGHIAGVGFDLYCQLLRQSISRLKGESAAELIRATVRLDFVTQGEAEGGIDATARASFNESFAALRESEERPPPRSIAAYVPSAYLGEPRLRIEIYRHLARCGSPEEVDTEAAAIADRFGNPPEPLEALILLTKIRTTAEHAGIIEVVSQGEKLKCQRKDGSLVQIAGRFPRLQRKQPAAKLREILAFLQRSGSSV